jgi:hypothetical protein
LLRKKQAGERIERPKEPVRSNVVNLIDALRQSIKAESGRPDLRQERQGSCSKADGQIQYSPEEGRLSLCGRSTYNLTWEEIVRLYRLKQADRVNGEKLDFDKSQKLL